MFLMLSFTSLFLSINKKHLLGKSYITVITVYKQIASLKMQDLSLEDGNIKNTFTLVNLS